MEPPVRTAFALALLVCQQGRTPVIISLVLQLPVVRIRQKLLALTFIF
jgi:hypothetical protein